MITNASELEFTSIDNDNWAVFLRTQTGQRLLPKLAELAPRLLSSGDTNAVLIRNGELLGFQAALQGLLDLQNVPPQPPKSASAYPSLDDDDAWPAL